MGKGQWRIDNALAKLEEQLARAEQHKAKWYARLPDGGSEAALYHAKAETQILTLHFAIGAVKGINLLDEEPPRVPHLRELRWRFPEWLGKVQENLRWHWRDKKQDAMSATEKWLRSRT